MIVASNEPVPKAMTAASWPMRSYAKRMHGRSSLDVIERFAHLPRLDTVYASSPSGSACLDFALTLGRVSTPRDVGSATRYGVWYFQHESDDHVLPFFREVQDGDDVTRAALMALRTERSEAAVLEEGHFRTDGRSYLASRDRVLEGIAAWPARVCQRLLTGADRDLGAPRPLEFPTRRTREKRVGFVRFKSVLARRRLELAWERLFRHPQWNIGALNVPVATLLAPGGYVDGDIEWFPLDNREGFLADPFGIVCEEGVRILCEYFDYRERKGRVYALEHSGDGFTQPTPALPLPVHASYPFLLESSDQIYCVPEASDANEVALYQAIAFPQKWAKVAVLIQDFAGVDPTLFSHDGRWWLMCTRKGALEDVELWAWHASALSGPWTPHARNPVKTDVRGARPAGRPFVHERVLYRPAQDCSRTYGWRIRVQRVLCLTPDEFEEESVTVLEASPQSPYPLGRHTLTSVGDMVLVDGRRAVFAWPAFRSFLGIWAAHLSSKARRA